MELAFVAQVRQKEEGGQAWRRECVCAPPSCFTQWPKAVEVVRDLRYLPDRALGVKAISCLLVPLEIWLEVPVGVSWPALAPLCALKFGLAFLSFSTAHSHSCAVDLEKPL